MSKKTKKAVRPKRPKLTSHNGYGIVSPYGDMWSSHIFPTREAAKAHIRDFWQGVKGHSLKGYRIVWARQAAHFIRETSDNAVQ